MSVSNIMPFPFCAPRTRHGITYRMNLQARLLGELSACYKSHIIIFNERVIVSKQYGYLNLPYFSNHLFSKSFKCHSDFIRSPSHFTDLVTGQFQIPLLQDCPRNLHCMIKRGPIRVVFGCSKSKL